jgi:ketosteroid isomerase-like protein
MIDPDFAHQFAQEWIQPWNSHNLDAILRHYSDDFEMTSPFIIKIAGEPSGLLRGKENVRAYWASALASMPELHFELISTLLGVNSITIYYRGVCGLSAEVFHFNADGQITQAFAHYA